MNQNDLDWLLYYAKSNNLMNKPFNEVYEKWLNTEVKETYEDYIADQQISELKETFETEE